MASFANEVQIIALVMIDIIQAGLMASGIAAFVEKLAGVDPVKSLDRLPDVVDSRYERLIWGPTGEDARKLGQTISQVKTIHHVLIAIAVIAFTLLIEAVGMLAISGVALAGYELTGVSLDIVGLLRVTVGFATLLAISMMLYGQNRLNQAYESC